MKFIHIPLSIAILIGVTSCDFQDRISTLQSQCEQDFANWKTDSDAPKSCYRHLEALNKKAGMRDDEDFIEFVRKIETDPRFAIHFEVEDRLQKICLDQYIPEEDNTDEVFGIKLGTPKCVRAREYYDKLGLRRPTDYKFKEPQPPLPSELP